MNVEKILAPNPGLFTGPGTNTYVIESEGECLVIDPGPIIDTHMESIVVGIGSNTVVGVLVTHSHIDHAPLAAPLGERLGVSTFGHSAGDGFVPDERLADGDDIVFGVERLHVVGTPGHSEDHLCFHVGSALFTGDHIMGGSTVMVQHMGEYLRSLEKVARLAATRLLPGHGPLIENPGKVIDYYISHRREREQQIIEALQLGDAAVGSVVERVYADIDSGLHPLAAMSVAAHLRKLHEEGLVVFEDSEELWDGVVRMAQS